VQDGFKELALQKIIGLVHPDNVTSQRVLEKAGLMYSNRACYFGLDHVTPSIKNSSRKVVEVFRLCAIITREE